MNKFVIFVTFLCVSACNDQSLSLKKETLAGLEVSEQNVTNDCSEIGSLTGKEEYNRVKLLDELAFCYGFSVEGELANQNIELNNQQQHLSNVLASILRGENYSLIYQGGSQGESVLKKVHITDSTVSLSEIHGLNSTSLNDLSVSQTLKASNSFKSEQTLSENTGNSKEDSDDSELFNALSGEWQVKYSKDEVDDFLQNLDINASTAMWMKDRIASTNESIEVKTAILQRVEIENNVAAKSIILEALKLSDSSLVGLSLDIIYSWGDNSLTPHLLTVSTNHPDDEIREQAQELYDYFSEGS